MEQASRFAKLVLACVQREWPNKLDHLLNDETDVMRPRELHPAFFGCLDWHSAVHGHWLLVHLLRRFPDLPDAAAIRHALDETLTAKNLAVEVAYFAQPNRQSFERMYGWAWLLQLATELHDGDDVDVKRWATHLQPLVDTIVARYLAFLPKQTYPVRTGVHANTAFGLALALDHARTVKHAALEALIVERATAYYGSDVDVPAAWEPGGEDFLSPALVEADLMRRVLPRDAFVRWLHAFLPRGLPASLAQPAIVSDRSDPKLAHLDGLNLSRAWCLDALASALPTEDAVHKQIAYAAVLHRNEGLAHVATGDYMGEHWLATFAVYLLRQ
ncbi:MAG TPA: DUF2891 domain-containing protein [Kofleriaceae bacterium]|nr:DUF2891 domain-containing protein [Kofleriaceae bacterium]